MRLSWDAKPQRQARERTQPGLPVTAGHPATRTHDYRRHGTLSLRAAMDLDTGQIYDACAARNRPQEFLAFLRPWARCFPTPQVHLVLDHDSPHRPRQGKAWQAAHPRCHCHFTPTYSSGLNILAHGFSAWQRQVLAHGSFAGVAVLQTTVGR